MPLLKGDGDPPFPLRKGAATLHFLGSRLNQSIQIFGAGHIFNLNVSGPFCFENVSGPFFGFISYFLELPPNSQTADR